MKKLILIVSLTFIGIVTKAQDTARVRTLNNEFGIDATAFIKQFFNLNQQQFYVPYSPTYYLTYRRHFAGGNLRLAIGADFSNQNITNPFPTYDSNKYYEKSYSVSALIGWEFVNNLGKRWQVFYGVDFRPSFTYSKNDAPYWNGGYANGIETQTQIYGIAPLLGVRFKLTKRLSILTETSYAINWEQDKTTNYFTPVTRQNPPIPSVVTPPVTKLFSTFYAPVSLFLDFTI